MMNEVIKAIFPWALMLCLLICVLSVSSHFYTILCNLHFLLFLRLAGCLLDIQQVVFCVFEMPPQRIVFGALYILESPLAGGLCKWSSKSKSTGCSGDCERFKADSKTHHLWSTINTCFTSLLIYPSSERTLMERTRRRGCWWMSGNHKSTGKMVVSEKPVFTAPIGS